MLMATIKKAVKKIVKKATVKKVAKKKEAVICEACKGRGLKDSYTLCTPCAGSGKIYAA